MHHQVIIPVTAGRLDCGPWRQVYYAEFDGQRRKRVIILVMGEWERAGRGRRQPAGCSKDWRRIRQRGLPHPAPGSSDLPARPR
jgi:hypothetical protein